VVVGPTELSADLAPGVLLTREQPPGGGPVAASAAGIALLPPEATYVALLAADLPFLTTEAVTALRLAATDQGVDGSVFVDEAGRRQSLCGVWRVAALASRLAAVKAQRGRLEGASLRELLDGLRVAELSTAVGKTGRRNTDGATSGSGGSITDGVTSGAGTTGGSITDGVMSGSGGSITDGVMSGSGTTGRSITDGVTSGSGKTGRGNTAAGATGLGETGLGPMGLGETGLGGVPGSDDATSGVGLSPPPWFDCDTEADLRRGERWVDGDAG
jgi:hypothetical protein